MAHRYLPRLVDTQLRRALKSAGAVLLEGPKACGKTSTAREQAASLVRLDASPQLRAAGAADPNLLLDGAPPRLIDEWQLVPGVWNAVRYQVDERQADGQFILTGSATPADDLTRHTGAGRFARIRMSPMSLAEAGASDGAVSLEGLFDGDAASSVGSTLELMDVAELMCRGGWPANLQRDLDSALAANRDYLATIAAADIVTVDGVRRDPRKVTDLIYALARNNGTYVTDKTLRADVAARGQTLATRTLHSYTDALHRLWITAEQAAWGQHLRSGAQLRKAPKRHLVDPSLAIAALGASPRALVGDPEAFGQHFESLVFRDLSIYAQAVGATVHGYQESSGAELDAVVVRDDQWIGIEVKLSARPDVVDAAAAGLLTIAGRMRRPPAALAVVTATGPSYRRPDGVHVISVLTLGP
ncbi:ATP-binding protein [Cellulomonas bogoriensis]|uniref:ATPase AAA n=2 Tax=Cellulomonas bogoriensis TaxID=301388 RepID=A0A0A0C0P6_9CELL|nr:ATPase AAA [Cellulomonas bogoriensis 69B4 = DSM 16987]